jgi:hypothetical protein
MTLDLAIPSDTEMRMRMQAAAAGLGLEDFVLLAVAEKLAGAEETHSEQHASDWDSKFRACIALQPAATHFVDDSRESIYVGSGE